MDRKKLVGYSSRGRVTSLDSAALHRSFAILSLVGRDKKNRKDPRPKQILQTYFWNTPEKSFCFGPFVLFSLLLFFLPTNTLTKDGHCSRNIPREEEWLGRHSSSRIKFYHGQSQQCHAQLNPWQQRNAGNHFVPLTCQVVYTVARIGENGNLSLTWHRLLPTCSAFSVCNNRYFSREIIIDSIFLFLFFTRWNGTLSFWFLNRVSWNGAERITQSCELDF